MSSPSSNVSGSLVAIDLLDKPVDILPAGTLVGRYVILHLLGHGAAGLVYAAYDGELDRKLALKFLRLRGDSEGVREASHRLRREAQAMARLSHPNVVSIHDVGRVSGHMFLVMDLVPGGTLRDWLSAPHSLPERLNMLCKAGDGLAAAHSAGVVHRDFKPANVLVDGTQPRVTDFGIAAAAHGEHSSLRPPPDGAPTPPAPGDGTNDAIKTVGVLGTIGYLSPEQAFMARVDARCDQFSFCVTLYEALYGILPFPSDDLLTYLNAVGKRAIRAPPTDVPVPRSVHAAILRGLRENPDDRFSSMAALLAELRRDRAREARRLWGFLAALAGALALVFFVVRTRASARAALCAEPDPALGGAWTPALREEIGALFAAKTPFGAKTFVPLSDAISAYAGAVANMRREACETARIRGTQSESIMTVRLECLDERAKELAALVRLLRSADEKLVAGAAESLSKLSSVTECADVPSLTAPVRAPTPAIAASVESMKGELAEIRALESIARYDQSADRATALEARVEPLHYPPLLAEVRYTMGRAFAEQGRHELAEKTLRAAIDTADEGKHDLLRGQAYVFLSLVVGRRLGHYDAAIVASTSALSIARRLGSQSLEADALERLGMDHAQTGLLEKGLEESTAALAIRERLGPEDLNCASNHLAIAIALAELGHLEESMREDRHALAIVDRIQGPTHPRAGVYRSNLSVDLVWTGHVEEAIQLSDEAIRILRDAVGTEHPDYALAVNEKGYALTKVGRFAEALALNQEAAQVTERVEGQEAASLAYPLVGAGEDLIGLDRPAEALPILERATRIAEADALDPETLGECHFQLARAVWLAKHDRVRSAALARKAAIDYARTPRLAPRARVAEQFAAEREKH